MLTFNKTLLMSLMPLLIMFIRCKRKNAKSSKIKLENINIPETLDISDPSLKKEWVLSQYNRNGKSVYISQKDYETFNNYSITLNDSTPTLINQYVGKRIIEPNSRSVHGFAGKEMCNNIQGKYKCFANNGISFEVGISTKVFCNLTVPLNRLLSKVEHYEVVKNNPEWQSQQLKLRGIDADGEGFTLIFYEVVKGKLAYKNVEGGFYGIELYSEKRTVIPTFDIKKSDDNIHGVLKLINLRKSNNQIGFHMSGEYCDADAYTIEPEIVYGRPLYIDKKEILAEIYTDDTTKSEWCNYVFENQVITDVSSMKPNEREKFISHWLNVAKHEHSSIASFAQLISELIQYSAPFSIIQAANRAMYDEIQHTKIALSLASIASNLQYNFKWLDIKPEIRSINRLADENYNDACINEAKSAEQLHNEAIEYKNKQKSGLSKLLCKISKDESRHAKLGKDIDTWIKRFN